MFRAVTSLQVLFHTNPMFVPAQPGDEPADWRTLRSPPQHPPQQPLSPARQMHVHRAKAPKGAADCDQQDWTASASCADFSDDLDCATNSDLKAGLSLAATRGATCCAADDSCTGWEARHVVGAAHVSTHLAARVTGAVQSRHEDRTNAGSTDEGVLPASHAAGAAPAVAHPPPLTDTGCHSEEPASVAGGTHGTAEETLTSPEAAPLAAAADGACSASWREGEGDVSGVGHISRQARIAMSHGG